MSVHRLRDLAFGAITALAVACAGTSSDAGWLSRLLQETGEAGSTVARQGTGALDEAGRYVARLPTLKDQAYLAAARESSGHWTFTNAQGETFTAASPEEMGRLASVMAPAAAAGESRLVLVMTEDVAIGAGRALDELPSADLRVLVDGQSFPLVKSSASSGELLLSAKIRSNLTIPLTDVETVREAIFQLERTLEPRRIRVLSLDQSGPTRLPAEAQVDPQTRLPSPDRIAPEALMEAIQSVPRQMVVLTGRLAGDQLVYRSASGAERALDLIPLKRAAAVADVDLVILTSPTPRQPGSRNWLWLRTEVSGLQTALKRSSFADFLNVLGEGQGELVVRTTRGPAGRVQLEAAPLDPATPGSVGGTIGTIVAEVASEAAGAVLTSGIEADLVGSERAGELDRRIIPGVPSTIQFGYLGLLVLGIFGLPVARHWWFRVWPAEERSEYPNAVGHNVARLARLVAFVALFLPLAGAPAAAVNLAQQLWALVTLPFRAIGWLLRLGRSKTA